MSLAWPSSAFHRAPRVSVALVFEQRRRLVFEQRLTLPKMQITLNDVTIARADDTVTVKINGRFIHADTREIHLRDGLQISFRTTTGNTISIKVHVSDPQPCEAFASVNMIAADPLMPRSKK